MPVLGVGATDAEGTAVAGFSAKGCTTEELPYNTGRVKPDLITYGTDILGGNLDMQPEVRSGTSIAAPLVTASLACIML